MKRAIFLVTVTLAACGSFSAAQATTYLDTRNLFTATSSPSQDLNIVNPTDGGTAQDSSIGLGTISADIPVQNDYYLNFSAPFPDACVTIVNNLQPSGTSFFNIAYFTSDGGGFLGHDDVVDNDIETLSDGTCVAHFRAVDTRSAGSLAVLQVRHFSGGYLIPSFPLVMTSGGTWTGPLVPYCGLHCRHYDGILYAQLSDNPLATPPAGMITVTTNNIVAIFSITDGSSHTFSGTGLSFTQTAPPGTYTISYGSVLGFSTPPAATAALSAGGTITFSGTYIALPPILSVFPATVDFERQIIGMPSSTKNVTIENAGGGTLAPIITISGDFSQTNNCPLGLSAGQACQVTVSFSPSEPGTRKGTLSISSSLSILNQQIVLTGVGTLEFPLKGSIPGSDQGLTAATAEINSVFDHSMQNEKGQYSIYDCDKKVIDFANEIGDTSPTENVGTRCEKGYSQTDGNPFEVNGNYQRVGNPRIIFYDGHPGYDFQSSFGNQAYAATAGTVHYPTLEELRNAGITVGGDPDDFHVLELDAAQDLKMFYLHVSTHPRTLSIHLEKPVTGEDFIGMQDSRFSSSVEPHREALKGSLSLTGLVTINGLPAAKVPVHLSGITAQSSCVDEVVETDMHGQYGFKGLLEGFYNVRPVKKGFGFEPTSRQAVVAEGAYVFAGELIGASGNAGPCLPPHLHFEVQRATPIEVIDHLNDRILRFIPVDPYGWHPVVPGTSDPYFEIPDLTSTGLSNETLWQVTNTNPQ